MKCFQYRDYGLGFLSLPAWGEWIEILIELRLFSNAFRLSPHGESGLKSWYFRQDRLHTSSLPAWGEWIEIFFAAVFAADDFVSPRMGRVD